MKYKITILSFLFICLISLPCQADITYTPEQLPLIIEDIYESLVEDGQDVDFEQVSIDLMQLHENPISINNATQSDLEQLLFLTDQQIDNILMFIYDKPIHGAYELRLVDGLAEYEIRNMVPFIVIEEAKENRWKKIYWKEMWHLGRQDIVLRTDMRNPEYSFTKNSYNTTADPFYISLKYRFNYRNRVQFGIQAERDAGEPFYVRHKTYGADYYGGYLQLQDFGAFRKIIVGDFNAAFGMGLILNTNMSYAGKTSLMLTNNYRQRGLQRKASTTEYNFFRGIAFTAQLTDKAEISAFYSGRKVDGKVENGTFPTILETGYHRTDNELNNKRQVWQHVLGANITVLLKRGRLSFTMTENMLSDTLSPKQTYYNEHYFRGKRQAAFSGTYFVNVFGKVFIMGELAASQNQRWGFANLTGLTYRPINDMYLKLMYRYYSPSYDNMLGNAFAENTHNTDENGLFLSIRYDGFRKWRMAGYLDLFRFKEPKYGYKEPSRGLDAVMQTTYTANSWVNMTLKLRAKSKYDKPKYSLRYQLQLQPSNWILTTTFEANRVNNKAEKHKTSGFLLAQTAQYNFQRVPIVLQARFEGFKATNYDNRFYLYENDVLYAFSVPMLYGKGLRYYINARYKINRHFSIYLKFGQTWYENEWMTQQKMLSQHRTELHTLFRVKF